MTQPAHFIHREIPHTLDWPGRFRLMIGVAVAFTLFHFAARLAGIPPVPGQAGSLLAQPSAAMAMLVTAGAMVVSCLLCKYIVGDLLLGPQMAGETGAAHVVQFEGGLVAALVGAFSLVYRIGPISYALFYAADSRVFVLLAAELMLLFGVVGFCWLGLQWTAPATLAQSHEPLVRKLSATGIHAAVMLACMIFLAQTETVTQTLAAVGISAMLASMAAHVAFPVRSTVWYWAGALLVGLIGYAMAYMNPTGMAIGFPDGPLGALARATPLAYATAGPAGAIFGYWVAASWQHGEAGEKVRG